MKVEQRREIERKIAEKVAEGLIGGGYAVSVDDGEEIVLAESTSVEVIVGFMFATDEDRLYAMKPDENGKMTRRGWVHFVYGNSGFDVVSDYTSNLEAEMAGATAEADRLELEYREGAGAPKQVGVIDLTPTWGEWGNLYTRFAESGETAAVAPLRRDAARCFASTEALKAIVDDLPEELRARLEAVYTVEMSKQGFGKEGSAG